MPSFWTFSLSGKSILITAIEITVITFIFYRLILVIRGTRAENVVRVLVILVALFFFAKYTGFNTIHWILEKILILSFFALPIIFQPEIRRGIEKIGRAYLWVKDFDVLHEEEKEKIVSVVSNAAYLLAEQKVGGLIAIEKSIKLDGFVEGGVVVDAKLNEEILSCIFVPSGPIHDGAVIIRGCRIYLAKCFFPLTDNPNIDTNFGSRHRAAIGLTESTDAVVVIISEEVGEVSIAHMGRLTKIPDKKTFNDFVTALLSTSYTYREKEG